MAESHQLYEKLISAKAKAPWRLMAKYQSVSEANKMAA